MTDPFFSRRANRRFRERFSRARVRRFLDESLRSSRLVDEAFLFSLNRMFLEGSSKYAQTAGQYRKKPVVVRWMHKVVYRPPKPELVPSLMKNFFNFAEAPHRYTDIEHSARIFLMLLKIHPFVEGNGRTARAVTTYLLLKKGYHLRRKRSLEEYIDLNLEKYNTTLTQSSIEDPSPWLPFFYAAVQSVMSPPSSRIPIIKLFSSMARRLVSLLHTY